jgi:hypothetical protein
MVMTYDTKISGFVCSRDYKAFIIERFTMKCRIRIVDAACIIIFLLIAACSGGSGSDETAMSQENQQPVQQEAVCEEVAPCVYGLWSEFLTPDETAAQIPVLKERGIALFQNIPSDKIFDEAYGELFRTASCSGVEVRAWLTLPEKDGYWPNEKNAALFSSTAIELAQWIRANNWNINWIVVDMEPDFEMLKKLLASLGSFDIATAVRILAENSDDEGYILTHGIYSRMVEELHSMGFKVMVTTFPMLLDDLADGDSTIQNLLNIPVDGIAWDQISIMAYSTIFESLLKTDVPEYLVYSYGVDAVKYYGDRAAIELGMIAQIGMISYEGISDPEVLKKQVGAAKAAGLKDIHAYSLDGILSFDNPQDFLDMFEAHEPRKVDVFIPVVLIRKGLQIIDYMIKD